jgi:hypothetical protein
VLISQLNILHQQLDHAEGIGTGNGHPADVQVRFGEQAGHTRQLTRLVFGKDGQQFHRFHTVLPRLPTKRADR